MNREDRAEKTTQFELIALTYAFKEIQFNITNP
jgi:hypothetical protein